ncbi:MAG: mechanosensitive ion channel [Kiritimatiellaceae bacterium]|nr:mechanosensitive ion channel [Kiritimatiellaceae bacterium]
MQTNAVQIVETPVAESLSLIEKIQSIGLEYGFQIIGALLIFIVGMWVVKMIAKIVVRIMTQHKVDKTLIGFVSGLLHVALQAFVVIAALGALNVPIASFVAVLGAAGLAVGLALQGSLSNFAAGVLMIIFRPFKVHDVVEAGGVVGTVQEIGILTTHIDTLDNKKTVVPNAKVMESNITNYTANDTRRVDLVAGISYSDDIDKARAAIKAAIAEIPEVLSEPAPDILVSEMADSSVNFAVRPWSTPADYWTVYFGVTEAIKKKFDAEGISIPFPQRDVHLYEHKEG